MRAPVRLLVASMVFSVVPFALAAQDGPPAGARRQPPTPKNLKVLPKDISGADLIKLMHQYEGDLGVECSFCHAKSAETGRLDFSSDANPMKDTARYMITMNMDINKNLLAKVPNLDHPAEISCGTCHEGKAEPPAFVPKPEGERRAPAASGPPAGL